MPFFIGCKDVRLIILVDRNHVSIAMNTALALELFRSQDLNNNNNSQAQGKREWCDAVSTTSTC